MSVLAHLKQLVAIDTRNPPRAASGIRDLLLYASKVVELHRFSAHIHDLGDGCMWLRATRGHGGPLVNIHVDTVPADAGWSRDPLVLHVDNDRAIGLGACDIKGALAAFLEAAEHTTGPAELLLTSDEEAGSSKCVRTFVAQHDVTGRNVVVAEPTLCRAVFAHRGIGTAAGIFTGTAGHASSPRAHVDNALHEAARWVSRALDHAAHGDLRFNLGILEGGVKTNMIASSAKVRFGVRPMRDPQTVVNEVCALAPDPGRVTWETGYLAPPLPAPHRSAENARAFATSLGLPEGAPVDFFTEAALFSEAGADAFVVGPGDIAQAHAPGEWVAVAQLDEMERVYRRVLTAGTR